MLITSCDLPNTVLKVKNRMCMGEELTFMYQSFTLSYYVAEWKPKLSAAVQHRERIFHYILLGQEIKIQNLKRLLLIMYHFHTTINLKNCKSNHLKSETIYIYFNSISVFCEMPWRMQSIRHNLSDPRLSNLIEESRPENNIASHNQVKK